MSTTTCPPWCVPAECTYASGGVHNGETRKLAPVGIGWGEHDTIEVYPSWAGEDGFPPDSCVYFYAPGEGPLTGAEARQLAAMLTEAADALDDDGAAR